MTTIPCIDLILKLYQGGKGGGLGREGGALDPREMGGDKAWGGVPRNAGCNMSYTQPETQVATSLLSPSRYQDAFVSLAAARRTACMQT